MNELKFLVWSPDVVFPVYLRDSESSAVAAAETLARDYQGKRFVVASVVATVVSPLPAVQWSYGAAADTNEDKGSDAARSTSKGTAHMKKLIPILFIVLSSCATAGRLGLPTADPFANLIQRFGSLTKQDLADAKATSLRSNDALGMLCWIWLDEHPIDTSPFEAKVSGVASAIAKKRAIMFQVEMYRSPSSPLRMGLMKNCGPLFADEQRNFFSFLNLVR